MSNPTVSVVIPCYNAERWLARAIRSALDQNYPDLDIIVIDDGSTDGSLDIIRSFGDRIRWETGPNRGVSAARNRGIALSSAEYISFLDADDWLLPGAIPRLVEGSRKLPKGSPAIAFGRSQRVNQNGDKLPDEHPQLRDGSLAPKVWMWLHGPRTTAPLHRRDYLMEIGGFEDGRPAGEDWDLHVRLMQHGVHFYYLDYEVYHYVEHLGNDRLTAQRSSPLYWSDIIGAHQILVSEGYSFTPEDHALFARYAWLRGRLLLRRGIGGAEPYFDFARRIAPELGHGTRTYRVICRILGPIRTERLSMMVRGWRTG